MSERLPHEVHRGKSRRAPIGLVHMVALGFLVACGISTSGSGTASDAQADATSLEDAQRDALVDGAPEGRGDATDEATDTGATDATARDAATKDADAASTTDAVVDALHDAAADSAEAGLEVPDTGTGDAACAGSRCNGVCLSGAGCQACVGAPLLCAPQGECVASCTGCHDAVDAALPVECFACDQNEQNPIGTCQPATFSSYCLSGNYYGVYEGGAGYHCACSSGDAGECPGGSQVCVAYPGGSVCETCGEPVPAGSGNLNCKTGTACNASAYNCN